MTFARNAFVAGLDGNLVTAIEENERSISGALADQSFVAIDFLFGKNAEGL